MKNKTTISVKVDLELSKEEAWKYWTLPEHITQWNFASDDWQCPTATNDVQPGGKFSWRMEAKDGSFGFDFNGEYNEVMPFDKLVYTIEDGRKVEILFKENHELTTLTETFEAEDTHSIEQQKEGWRAILNNYKKHAENSSL